MWDEYRERWNEAERIFTYRFDAIAANNFKMVYRNVRVGTVVYLCVLLGIILSAGYMITGVEMLMVPEWALAIWLTDKFAEKSSHRVMPTRLLCLCVYFLFLTHVNVLDQTLATRGYSIRLFPMMLVMIAGVYMDHMLLMIAFFVATGVINLIIATALNPATANDYYITIFSSVAIAIFLYWEVLGIYTEERRDNRLLEEKSSRDLLTGLYNKVSTETLIERYLSNEREGTACALLIIDFDNFKSVNDTYGHLIGDKVLKAFGAILRHNFRESDIIGRMGGDEFMVLMKEPVTEDMIIRQCNAVEMELATTAIDGARGFSCSIGVLSDSLGFSFGNMYRLADDAVYEAKARGKAQYVLWRSKRVIPPGDKIAIYIASADRRKRDLIKQVFGEQYLFYENASGTTEALNEISLYGERLECILLDYETADMTKEQLDEYMASRPLFQVVPVHDMRDEITADLL